MSGAVETADVVIVGAGIEGLSTAYWLAERSDLSVVVVDRDTVGSGGTGRSSGVVRCHYGIPDLAAMAWFGAQFLASAPERLGDDVGFVPSGYVLVVGERDRAALHANVAAVASVGAETRVITPAEAKELIPWLEVDDVAAAAYEPRGGFGDAYRTAQAFSTVARLRGMRLQQHRPVTGLRTRGDRVVGVETATGPIDAGTVVVAAGAWSRALLAPIGLDLPIRSQREQLLIVSPGGALPPTPVLSDLIDLQYVRFEPNSDVLVGNSDHSVPEIVDPDRFEPAADADFIEAAVAKVAHRLPGLPDPRLRSTYAGCYDITPDYNPVIDATTGVDGLVVCAGFSGHGFKISPAVGALVTDLVLGETTLPAVIDPAHFALDRWARGTPLVTAAPYVGAGQMR